MALQTVEDLSQAIVAHPINEVEIDPRVGK
jgi:hypothetical protein